MQTQAGRALLAGHGLDPDDPASFLLIEYDRGTTPRVSTDTDAIRRVLAGLGGGWRVAHAIALLPRRLRDAAYRGLARNRYRWFGRHEACSLPVPGHRQRFL
jgi:predicted DCC family thiol-disulfide oxidoreductase YuxK